VERALGEKGELKIIMHALDDWVGRISRKDPSKKISEIAEEIENSIRKLERVAREGARSVHPLRGETEDLCLEPNEGHTGKEKESQEDREYQSTLSVSLLDFLNCTEGKISESEDPPILVNASNEGKKFSEEEHRTWEKLPVKTGGEGAAELKTNTAQDENSECLIPGQAEKLFGTAYERVTFPLTSLAC
jgi:hypothetical protein